MSVVRGDNIRAGEMCEERNAIITIRFIIVSLSFYTLHSLHLLQQSINQPISLKDTKKIEEKILKYQEASVSFDMYL